MRKSLWVFAALAVALSVSNFSQPVIVSGQKFDKYILDLMNSNAKLIPALVTLKEQADVSGVSEMKTKEEKGTYLYKELTKVAMETQKDLVEYLQAEKITYRQYYITNMVAVFGVTKDQLKAIAEREDVARVTGNPEVKNLEPVDFATASDLMILEPSEVGPNLKYVKADQVWENYSARGEGIVVAGQDTGIDWDHEGLKAKYRGFVEAKGKEAAAAEHNYNWHDSIHEETKTSKANPCGYDTNAPCDDNGHGTHTMGTVLGSDDANVVGMAPDAKFIGCRNMDEGFGTPARYIECYEFFLAPYPFGGNKMEEGRPDLAPHVINNSWGCPEEEGCYGDELLETLKVIKAAGIVNVVSAGNEGSECETILSPPASHTNYAFTVGAIDHRSGNIASFSSRGPSKYDGGMGPDVSAPGVSIRSTINGGGYSGTFWSGTSMAGPHVAGLVALLWSANRDLVGDVNTTEQLIRDSAMGKTTRENCGGVPGSEIPNNTYGHGIIDALKATQMAMALGKGGKGKDGK